MTGVLFCFLTCHCGSTGVERIPNKSQNTKLTLERKILPPLMPGFELATFRSRVRRCTNWAIPATGVKHAKSSRRTGSASLGRTDVCGFKLKTNETGLRNKPATMQFQTTEELSPGKKTAFSEMALVTVGRTQSIDAPCQLFRWWNRFHGIQEKKMLSSNWKNFMKLITPHRGITACDRVLDQSRPDVFSKHWKDRNTASSNFM